MAQSDNFVRLVWSARAPRCVGPWPALVLELLPHEVISSTRANPPGRWEVGSRNSSATSVSDQSTPQSLHA